MKEKSQFNRLITQILLEAREDNGTSADWSEDRTETEDKFGEDYRWSDDTSDNAWTNDDDKDSPEFMKNLFRERLKTCSRIENRRYLTNWRDCWSSAGELAGVYGPRPIRKDAYNWVEKEGDGVYVLCSVAGFEKGGFKKQMSLKGYRVEATVRFYKQKGNLYFKLVEMKQFHPDGKGPKKGESNSPRDYYNITKWAGGKRVEGEPVLKKIMDYVESETGPIA